MEKLTIRTEMENLPAVQDFVVRALTAAGYQGPLRTKIRVALEEIYANIVLYAYGSEVGNATIEVEITENPKTAVITLRDQGTPYNPLSREDPDVTLKARDRRRGGLGIFMTKKLMDQVSYAWENGQNVLTLIKRLE